METPTPAVPAQPETPLPTISASRDAANRNDFSAFDKAESAARLGKPLAEVAVATETPKPAVAKPETPALETPPSAPVSKRQEAINNYERRIAEQDQRIRALESQISAPAAPRSDPAPPAPTRKEHERYLAMPDAPKFEEFDSIPAFNAAMSIFIDDKRHEERETARQTADRQREAMTAHETKVKAFDTRVDQAVAADPEFVTKVSPVTSQLQPSANARAEGKPVGPLNILADELIESERAMDLLAHLAAHPDAFEAFKACPTPQAVTRMLARLDATLPAPKSETPTPAPVPKKFISDAPPPPPILATPSSSTDPQAAALARNDFSTWDRIETQKELAKRRGA